MKRSTCIGENSFAGLALRDGTSWQISAGHKPAFPLVSQLRKVMKLGAVSDPTHYLSVCVMTRRIEWMMPSCAEDGTIQCFVGPVDSPELLVVQLGRLSLVMVAYGENQGGLLLHGALAEKNGSGVILAGPAGIGKTTASKRLPLTWRSLSDDATLVVSGKDGRYWAHPWPTWSRLLSGEADSSWDVQHAVPLTGIFFLSQASSERVEPIEVTHAIGLLSNSAEEFWRPVSYSLEKHQAREQHLKRFDNVCSLAQAIPCYRLYLSLTGDFWQYIEYVQKRKNTAVK